eukprot:scaffold212234_cov33-Prasinocladus_malaysianus.AAC.2
MKAPACTARRLPTPVIPMAPARGMKMHEIQLSVVIFQPTTKQVLAEIHEYKSKGLTNVLRAGQKGAKALSPDASAQDLTWRDWGAGQLGHGIVVADGLKNGGQCACRGPTQDLER